MVWALITVTVLTNGIGKFGADSEVRIGLDVYDTLEECIERGEAGAKWNALDYLCLPIADVPVQIRRTIKRS